jgi:phosphopantothenoylcysteine synthetase/decarboxylase
VVLNDVSRGDIGFGASDNEVTLLRPNMPVFKLPKAPKQGIAQALLDMPGHIVLGQPVPAQV